ncbi:DUF3793 family protein [Anaeromicropila herbilytica]|uniref:DUF3793 family protein n=1 Tax=Anaeromicropila herbilytica TaxID=2785025 RepID=A0A7R7IBZ9_9FIRM|nr:DUF3793 family protein [Anaeromicropila herbilytica]BCN29374.1 hypothetical protein bsdtb5_06690 [Anaeromicropila herbilytica]
MARHMNEKEFERLLAVQCAPLLIGIKISSTVILDVKDVDLVVKMFDRSTISYYKLYQNDEKLILLLYRKNDLITYLNKLEVRDAMIQFGYHQYDLRNILKEFSKRYCIYMMNKEIFPHELGLILGYPVHDVIGFMQNQGRNSLYSGYWKVYDDLAKALLIFESYGEAKKIVLQMLSEGMSIPYIIHQYKSKERKVGII